MKHHLPYTTLVARRTV